MIIVKLKGGLGNQMFQYALGRHLAEINNTNLKLDLTFLQDRTPRENFTYRNYELGVFNILENFCETNEVEKIKKRPKKIRYFLHNLRAKILAFQFINEKKYSYDNNIFNSSSDAYLDGYWHSEKYFKNIEHILRKEFCFKNTLDEINSSLAESIANTESVSVHVRRSDYISNTEVNSYHGVCSIDYYKNSIELLQKKIKTPHFFVFSDDIEWTKNNLEFNHPVTYIDHNFGSKSFEDMRLMSLCRHNIIANSSFSWWGAWLNSNKEKVVIAPQKWFNDYKIDTSDLIPTDWIRI